MKSKTPLANKPQTSPKQAQQNSSKSSTPSAAHPPDIREDISIDIDDVEAEIQKPEKERSLPKLKKRLLALLTAVSVIATPIAATTDFANNVLEIGNKLHIELKLPFAP